MIKSVAEKDRNDRSAAATKDQDDQNTTTKDQSVAMKDREDRKCCKGSEYQSASTKDRKIEVLLPKDQVIVGCRR